MHLFPHVLVRIAGLPFSSLELLLQDRPLAILPELSRARSDLARHGEKLADALHEIIPTITNPKERSLLLGLRRDVYNGRPPKPRQLAVARLHLITALDDIEGYARKVLQLETLQREYEQAFEQGFAAERRELRCLSGREVIRRGLVLASRSLLAETAGRLRKKPTQSRSGKTTRAEQSALRYVSRTAAKTSPFSTFTQLACASLTSGPIPNTSASIDNVGSTRVVVNLSVYGVIRQVLLAHRPVSKRLPLVVNPTVEQEGNTLTYLLNSYNVESFQRVSANAIILRIIDEITGAESLTLSALVERLVGKGVVSATALDLEAYLYRLIDNGLLDLRMPVSANDPEWHVALSRWMLEVAGDLPEVERAAEALLELERLRTRYPGADARARSEITDRAFDAAQKAQAVLRAAGPENDAAPDELSDDKDPSTRPFRRLRFPSLSVRPENVLYEDVLREGCLELTPGDLEPLVKPYDKLLRLLVSLLPPPGEMMRAPDFFTRTYATGTSVPLLQFYEDFYRDMHAAERPEQPGDELDRRGGTGSERPAGGDGGEAEPPARLRRFADRLLEVVRTSTNENIVRLSMEELRNAAVSTEAAEVPAMDRYSLGAFLQLVKPPSSTAPTQAVVNSVCPGHGKLLSRFLQYFPESVTQDLRCWNGAMIEQDELFAECCDASFFNANIHPPLLPLEIWIPGAETSLPENQQIPATKLVVEQVGEALILRHVESGKRVYVQDLGFQHPFGRSPLFRLLGTFSLTPYVTHRPLLGIVNRGFNRDLEQITVLPRVVLDDRVILQRTTWIVPRSEIPQREDGEPLRYYFARLDAWRSEHGLPCDVFFRPVNPPTAPRTGRQGPRRKVRPDKPQYLSFRSGLFAEMLARTLKELEAPHFAFEEMLPGPADLMGFDGEGRVTEYLVQWYHGFESGEGPRRPRSASFTACSNPPAPRVPEDPT